MIGLRDITVRFGEKDVLSHLDLTLPDEGTVWIRGASGTGKTTLLRVLAGLLEPDAGTVSGMRGRRIGFVFQEDRLLPWRSALGNITVVSGEARALQLLEALGLSEAGAQLPSALSGGMRRRVAIARAMAYSGDVLLLDEPFSGLDTANRTAVAQALKAHARLIVLVSHDAADAALLDARQIAVLGSVQPSVSENENNLCC